MWLKIPRLQVEYLVGEAEKETIFVKWVNLHAVRPQLIQDQTSHILVLLERLESSSEGPVIELCKNLVSRSISRSVTDSFCRCSDLKSVILTISIF